MLSTTTHSTARALALLSGTVMAWGALASPAAPAAAPGDGTSIAQGLQQAAALRRQSQLAGARDVQPPQLLAFTLSGSVNATRNGQTVLAQLRATDDLSGVSACALRLVSPSGLQMIERWYNLGLPQKRFSSSLTIGSPSMFMGPSFDSYREPGDWVADQLILTDVNGNVASFSRAQLEQLSGGHASVRVSNSQPDGVAPVLQSATVLTPQLSVSTPPRGSLGSPYAGVQLTVQDTGQPRVSGVGSVQLMYCKPDGLGSCLETLQLAAEAPEFGQATLTLQAGGRTWYATPGLFHPHTITLQDVSGRVTVLRSLQFGGETDFSSFFTSGGSIELLP